jgi:hypothetical protein
VIGACRLMPTIPRHLRGAARGHLEVGGGVQSARTRTREVEGMKLKSGSSPIGRLRQRRERKRREQAERLGKRPPAQSGPDRTGRGDQWMGPAGG